VLDEPDAMRDPVAEPTENLEAPTPDEGKVILPG